MGDSARATPILETQLFRDVFNASPIGIAVENLDGQPLFVNPAFCRFLGFTEEELRRKHCVDFSPREDAEKDWTFFQQLRAGSIDHYQLEKRYFRRDGSLVWGRLSLSLLNSHSSPLVIAMVEDITDKKKAEESLSESEERLRLAAQAGRMFAYSWDAATDVIERSGESAAILGVKSDQAATGAAISAMVHPDDKQRLEAALSELNIENPTLQITYRINRPDGVVTWLERNSRAYFDARGKLKRIVGMIADVTERKRAEEARFRLAAIVESSDDAILSKTLDGAIVSWNAGAQQIYGYTEAEAVGKPITILVPPELRDEENKILERLRAGERIEHYETLRITKAGRRINVSISLSPIKDSTDTMLGICGIARDITERKLADEALRASEARLRLAQQAARIGTFEWNIKTGVNTWTRELEAMYGLPPGGFEGTQTAFENLVHPDDRTRVIELDNWALKTGQPTAGEWRVVWADGSMRWIAGRWQVFMDASGEPSRMVGINIDITERKRAEQELSKANERLRLALDAGSAGGWDYDLKTGKNVWFGTAHAQLGMTPDETSGSRKEFWDRIHEDDRERVEHALQLAKEKREEYAEDVRVVWRDGTTHWLRSRGRFQYDANGEAERSLGISLDITERKRAEERLQEYERAVENAEEMIGVIDREYRFLLANRQYLEMRNLTREQVVGHFIPEVLGAEIFETVIKPKLDECFQGKVVRYERKVSYPTIGERDLLLSYFPIEGVNGVDRAACILHDITDRKRAEEELSGLTRKLIEAQEQERARIARELHDDINQRLAMLAVELEQLQGDPSDVQNRVQELRKQTVEISDDVQALSHELHSSKLEYLGVVAGMKSWHKEFAERHRVEINFRSDVSSVVPFQLGVSLFRVLQEALHNAAKHSGVKRIEVLLREDSGEIHLIVGDSGSGFDVEAALRGKGLGLTSMRERVRLVNGTIAIDSKPMGGTTIQVRVPLESQRASQQKAG